MGLSTGTKQSEPYTIHDHPRAMRSIETTRSWAALFTFGIGGLLSYQAGSTLFDALLRGIVAGSVMFLLAWGVSVMIWRELVRAEIVKAREEIRERRQKAREAILEAQRAAAERHAK